MQRSHFSQIALVLQFISRLLVTALFLGLCFTYAPQSLAASQELAVDISQRDIKIRSNFDGANLLIFGSFRAEEPEKSTIILVVQGPKESLTVWRKSPVLGMWFNTSAHDFNNVPSYYAALSSGPLDHIWDKNVLSTGHVGLAHLDMNEGAVQSSWRAALMAIKTQAKLYLEDQTAVSLHKESLFRADVRLPSTAKPGLYTVSAYHFNSGRFTLVDEQELLISRVGFGAYLSKLAHQNSVLYGALCVLMALLAGYATKVIFARHK